jgi:hypothetical protein
MNCKCCGEEAEFKLIEEGFWDNRYKCGNCNKCFRADKAWLQTVKTARNVAWVASILLTGAKVTYHLAAGNPEEAVATLANHFNIDESDNDSMNA